MAVVLSTLNYALVLLYGILLSVSFAGGCTSPKDRWSVAVLSITVMLVQALCWLMWGLAVTARLYPLISHIPLVLTLAFALKKPWFVAISSVLTAYFCCQLPRWIGTIALYLFETQLAYQLVYLISIFPIFILLCQYFSQPAYKAMTYSAHSPLLFGGLPLLYYLFDYTATVYTKALYEGVRMVSELLPAAMALFFMLFVTIYHHEVQRRNQIELQNSMLAMQLEQAKYDVFAFRQMQEQTATYRHDMRHHLSMISGYLVTDDTVRAREYIQAVELDIENITPVRYCENTAANLILSAFAQRAKKLGVVLSVEANINDALPLSETELSALLSNSIENAVTAASQCGGEERRVVRINCQLHKGNLLICIKNPYEGKIIMQNGLPQSSRPQHGFGVKSIKMIAESHGGFCSFDARDGAFTLKAVLPLGAERRCIGPILVT